MVLLLFLFQMDVVFGFSGMADIFSSFSGCVAVVEVLGDVGQSLYAWGVSDSCCMLFGVSDSCCMLGGCLTVVVCLGGLCKSCCILGGSLKILVYFWGP